MSTAGIIKVSVACPVFDGTEYPYWKNKMRMHLEAIDVDLWYVINNGIPKTGEGVTPADVKKFVQLDSTAKNTICGHLTKGQYGRVSDLETSKLVWDWLSKVNEGVSTQRDQRISVLCNLFNRFKRNDNENVQLTFDRLTDITNELHALGATEITKHEIIKTLLRSLDNSFDTLALMIQERPDFKTLDPSDILERLNTHEFQLSEKRDIYGPNYGRTRALKAKVVSSSEEESDCSSGDPEDIGKELAMLVKKFQKFTKKKGLSLHDPSQEVMKLPLMITRREHVTSARNLDTTSLSVHSGTMRTTRRRRARNMILMTRRRRNLQSCLL